MGKITDRLKEEAAKLGKKNESFALRIPFVKEKIQDILILFDLYHETLEALENEIDDLKKKVKKLEKK